jgi:hypothetical protein
MSSVHRTLATIDKPPTKFSALITPSYDDTTLVSGETIEMPIPFTVSNQVLDINVGQSTDIQAFVNNGADPKDQANIQGKAFGGAKVVTSFGANMTTYLRNWIYRIQEDTPYDPDNPVAPVPYTGPLVLYIQPLMTKVQLANPSFAIDDPSGPYNSGPFKRDRSWGVTTEAPVSTEYTGGGSADNYFTAWIFKTPMTIQYVVGGTPKYITMTSQFAEE